MTLGIFRNPVYPGMSLSYAELTLLLFLFESPTIRIEDLAAYFRVNKSSMSRKLKTLEKEGLIIRQTVVGKARKRSYHLTPVAKNQMEKTVVRSQNFLILLHEYMGQDNFDNFFELMKSATDAIDRISKEHSDVY
jgi:DNA-binding MarR family transcriptional regulator